MSKEEFCEWYNDRYDDVMYETCGPAFTFFEGGVASNEFKFCPYCGRPIKEVWPEDEDDER